MAESAANGNGESVWMPWDSEHPLKVYFEAMRDKIVADFELKGLEHKPKMVAVTSCGHGAGVSTMATGLAASLSETGGGSVLLVDMNVGNGVAHPLYQGKPGCGLPDVLVEETRDSGLLHDNLYMASAQGDDHRLRVIPRTFSHLMPKMKASDYDYIIFDMPPLSQISPTSKLAGFMDSVLVVVESEITDQDFVKRAQALLESSNVHACTVLNKYHRYVPGGLAQEF